jgi:hypothetical protein
MGITIYARGKIDRLEDIPRLIDEVKGIAEESGWEYAIIDDDFDVQPNAVFARRDLDEPATIEGSLGLKGIIVSIDPKAEPLAILFDRSGVLTDMMQQVFRIHNNVRDEHFIACKTQFGSIESHINIIELLDVLKKRYITDLVINDEGAYWESRDYKLLAEKRTVLEHYMRHTEMVIGNIEISEHDVQDSEIVSSHIKEALLEADKKGGLHH